MLPVNTAVVLRGFIPGFLVTVSGDRDGTPLVNTDGSAGTRDLQPASRDSRGEPLIPGRKDSK